MPLPLNCFFKVEACERSLQSGLSPFNYSNRLTPQNQDSSIFRGGSGGYGIKCSEGIIWETLQHGRKRRSPCIFSKEIFTLWSFRRSFVVGLSAHFLGNQGGSNATLLPLLRELSILFYWYHPVKAVMVVVLLRPFTLCT